LLIGIVVFALQMYLWLGTGVFSGKWEIWTVTEAIFEWTMMLELIGYAATYCNKPSRLLSYANEAVYPFYILHMTVSYSLGYYLKKLRNEFVFQIFNHSCWNIRHSMVDL